MVPTKPADSLHDQSFTVDEALWYAAFVKMDQEMQVMGLGKCSRCRVIQSRSRDCHISRWVLFTRQAGVKQSPLTSNITFLGILEMGNRHFDGSI
jgi:hypothetical protein